VVELRGRKPDISPALAVKSSVNDCALNGVSGPVGGRCVSQTGAVMEPTPGVVSAKKAGPELGWAAAGRGFPWLASDRGLALTAPD